MNLISPKEFAKEIPKPILRPCDHGLYLCGKNLESQLGTIEAYNRLVAKAQELKAKIDAGKSEAPLEMYWNNPRGG